MKGPNALREERKHRGWNQTALADLLGASRSTINRWEQGKAVPDRHFQTGLCQLYGKTAAELGFADTFSYQQETQNIDPHIPLPTGPFIARDALLGVIKNDLMALKNLALDGLPGVGKTALAIALAHDQEVREHFSDGILWASLGPEPNIQGQFRRWGTLLGLSTQEMNALNNIEAWALALRAAMGTRRMLLVIDDAWKIEEGLAFKVGGPNCAHLITTRFPRLASSFGEMVLISELSTGESVALLRLLAPQVVEQETEKIRALVQAVGGLPLALTLMGNYLRQHTYSGQLRRIHAALEQLSNAEARLQLDEPRAPSNRHPSLPTSTSLSLQSIIAVTDQHLQEQARGALYALSVFPAKPNNFSEEAALLVAGCSVETLDELSDAGLLESSSEGRYTLHQIIADYARTHLQGIEPHKRLISYTSDVVERHQTEHELLDQESSIIITALEAATTHHLQGELIRGFCAFAPFLLVRGQYDLIERLGLAARDAAIERSDLESWSSILLSVGQGSLHLGKMAQAEIFFELGFVLARRFKRPNQSTFLAYLGHIRLQQDNAEQAKAFFEEGLSLSKQAEDEIRCRIGLGTLLIQQRKVSFAKSHFEAALLLAQAKKLDGWASEVLIHLVQIEEEQGGNLEEIYYEALRLARITGHKERILGILYQWGVAQQRSDLIDEGLMLARRIKHQRWSAYFSVRVGQIALERGQYPSAACLLQEAYEICKHFDEPELLVLVVQTQARIALACGEFDKAELLCQQALEHSIERTVSFDILARIAQKKGDRAQEAFYQNLCLHF